MFYNPAPDGSGAANAGGSLGTLQPVNNSGAPKTATRPADSSAILSVAIELLAVGTFTLIAGINQDFGKLMIIFMIGLWLIFMIQESSLISSLEKIVTTA